MRTRDTLSRIRDYLDRSDPHWRETLRADLDAEDPDWEEATVSVLAEDGSRVRIVLLANPERHSTLAAGI
jgi:hypothetical protein